MRFGRSCFRYVGVNNTFVGCFWLKSASSSFLLCFMDYSFLTGYASGFWHITSGVCRAVAACLGGGGRPATLSPKFVVACYLRVNRAQHALLAVMARVQAGRQRVLVRRDVAAPDGVGRAGVGSGQDGPDEAGLDRGVAGSVISLPRRFGWLVHLVGYQAAGHASQLSHLLDDPDMVALVRDVPQARRILRPLCRMLGIACPGIQAAKRVRGRQVVAARDAADGGLLVADPPPPPAPAMIRHDYRPSARWPRGVMTRAVIPRGTSLLGSGLLKPA